MKKIKFLAMMIAALTFCMGFTACGDDDDDNADNPLIGTWVGTYDYEGGYTANEEEVVTMTFTSDGKMTAKGESASYNWSFSGEYNVTTQDLANGRMYLISLGGYFAGEDEYYDDDLEPEPFYINGNELVIFFDGSHYRLVRQ